MSITLKAARVNAGLTQTEAANRIGINITTLHKYESGKAFPNVPTVKKMEKLYKVKYADINFLVHS